jgi:hypothetical protein
MSRLMQRRTEFILYKVGTCLSLLKCGLVAPNPGRLSVIMVQQLAMADCTSSTLYGFGRKEAMYTCAQQVK